jgi:autotransporter translocation and assembly factor TamB
VLIKRPGTGQAKVSAPARLLSLNLDADLGRHFHFRGAGVESRLVGALKVRSDGQRIAAGDRFDPYRGWPFRCLWPEARHRARHSQLPGLIDNPGLNIRAMRSNLPVEAGVEVTGTARRPIVRLVSDPEVPDAEKLSWLVLGHAPDQQRGQDTAVLAGRRADAFSAAGWRAAEGRAARSGYRRVRHQQRLGSTDRASGRPVALPVPPALAPATRPPDRSSASASGCRRTC